MLTEAHYLARNLVLLRQSRGLSQADLGKLAKVPRSTLAHLESGKGNPTLEVLVRLSSSLGVHLEELVTPLRGGDLLIKAKDLMPISKANGLARVFPILPDAMRGLQMERLELQAGGHLGGVPHLPQTREFFHGFIGTFHIHVAGNSYEVCPGDILVFEGNQKHSYQNRDSQLAIGMSIVVQVPN